MSFQKKGNVMGRKAAWTVLLAIVILLAFQAMAAAKPLGTFLNLTDPNGRDDTMPDMKVGRNDSAHIVYQAYDGTDNDIFYKTNTSGGWVTTRLTNDSLNDINPKLELDGNDCAYVTWSHWDGSDYEIEYATNVNGSWATGAVTNNAVDDARPSIAMSDSPTLYSVTVANINTAWAAGAEGTIIKTTDGGTTWGQQNSTTKSLLRGIGVAMASPGVVWAVGAGGTILKTVNGGTTWASQASGTTKDLYGVTVVDANVAWAVGGSGTVLYTTNGGSTWTLQTSAVSLDLYAVSAVDANIAWAVGAMDETGYEGCVIHTIDAGVTWIPQNSNEGVALTGVAAVDVNTAWAVGAKGNILKTVDAGAIWDPQDSGAEVDLQHISAVSATQAYAVGESGLIFYTTDGTAWKIKNTDLNTKLYGVAAVGINDAWAVGWKTMILHTSNGSYSWTIQYFSIAGYVWIAYESYDADTRRPIILVSFNRDGSWKQVYKEEMAVAIKHPTLAISSDGTLGHLSFIIQDSSYWRLVYEMFDARAGVLYGGLEISSTAQMETYPSIALKNDSPLIVYQAWSDAASSYDLFVVDPSSSGNTVQITSSASDEFDPVLNRNPRTETLSIGFQVYDSSKDYYPALARYDSIEDEWAIDTYNDVKSKVASRTVGIVANDNYNVHFCYAGQDPDLDIYYGYLTPSPWGYRLSSAQGYPQTTVYPYSPRVPGDEGDHIFIYGSDFGGGGTVYMRRLENGTEVWSPATIIDWKPQVIEIITPEYNYVNLKPVKGNIKIHANGQDFITSMVYTPLYPTVTKVTPGAGWPYDLITIEGSNFGETQGDSIVFWGNGYAVSGSTGYYPKWKDNLIDSKIPAVASQGGLNVYVSGAGTEGGSHKIMSTPTSAFDLTLTDVDWYFAEGYTGPGFQEYLCVLNPNNVDVKIKVNFILEKTVEKPDEGNFAKEYSIPAHQRFTLSVNGEAPNSNVSLRIASSGRVICERPIYFNYRDVWTGGHNVVGANQPSNEWYFAEGTTRAGFDEWLCIMNPDTEKDAKVKAYYMNATGEVTEKEYVVPKASRFTVDVNDEVGADQDISIKVVSTGAAVVAERPMYFNYAGVWTGGHDTMGAQKLESHWYFAEGTTRGNFDEWLCIGNPGSEATTATVTYYITGVKVPVVQACEVAAHSRYTIKVNDAIGPELDVSVSVVTDKPTVVERPMYFNYGGSWTGGHDVIGSNFITEGWYLAEGTNRAGFEEWLCLLNPNEADCSVGVRYILGTGETVDKTYTIGANQRYTVFVNGEVPPDSDISIIVTSSLPILVERPMYFDFQGWTGGHDVVGYSPLYIQP